MVLLYGHLKDEVALRESQNKLKKLTDKNKIFRTRNNIDESYIYFLEKQERYAHTILLNWMILWWQQNNKNFINIHYYEYEKKYNNILQSDYFLVGYNKFAQQYRGVFFEMDNTIKHDFDKIIKYNNLFEARIRDKWSNLTQSHFPSIIIATTDNGRLREINKRINKDNRNKLNFQAYLIWDLKGEFINAKKNNMQYCNITGIPQYCLS